METVIALDSHSVHSVGKSSDFTVQLDPPLYLDNTSNYKLALISADMWYSWYNITKFNNRFKYHNGTEWKLVRIPHGAYNIEDINLELKRLIKKEGDDGTKVTIEANYNTSKSRVLLDGYKVDFISNSIGDVLGFEKGDLIEDPQNDSSRQVNITNIQSILIRCSLVSNSYLNGTTSDVIYSFSPDLPPGNLLHVSPNQLTYVQISRTEMISQIRMIVSDQNSSPIDFNGERTTFLLHIKKII